VAGRQKKKYGQIVNVEHSMQWMTKRVNAKPKGPPHSGVRVWGNFKNRQTKDNKPQQDDLEYVRKPIRGPVPMGEIQITHNGSLQKIIERSDVQRKGTRIIRKTRAAERES